MTVGRSKEQLITLGQRIRDLRLSKGLTQTELAGGLISASMVSQIESAKAMPGARVLAALAERLDTTVEELLTDITFDKMQMSAYRLALSQMAVSQYLPALRIFEDLLQEEGIHHEIASDELLLNLAVCYRETDHHDEAVKFFKKLIALFKEDYAKLQNFHLLVEAYLHLSETYLRMGKYFEALCEANLARDEYEARNTPDPLVHGQIVLQLANIYEKTHKFDEARECYEQAVKVYSELNDDLGELGLIYQRLAEVYYHQENPRMTVEFANKALVQLQAARMLGEYRDAKRLMIVQQVNDENWQDSVAILLNLAAIHAPVDRYRESTLLLDIASIYFTHDTEQCFDYCLKALASLGKKNERSELAGKSQHLLGCVYQKRGELDRARLALEQAMDIFKQVENLGELEKASRQLTLLFVQQGDDKKALENNEATQDFIKEQLNKRGVVL